MTEPRCPACRATELTDFFSVERLPVDVGKLPETREAAREAPRGDVTLCYCHACGFVFNRIHDASKVVFQPGYEAFLTHSRVFLDFLEGVAERLVERFDLHGRTILEIGCGSGHFLEMLCRRGGNHGIGIDPSLREERRFAVGQGSVELVRDHFAIRHLECEPDFICCQSVFEDIPEPLAFLSELRRALGQRATPVYLEIWNAMKAFGKRQTWSVNYEQCSYFGLDALTSVFRRSGFEVLEAAECYEDGQYIYVDAVPASVVTEATTTGHRARALPPELAGFGAHHCRAMARWRERLATIGPDGERAVVWGSGCKALNFLNALDTGDRIEFVVDINPERQGLFIPGAGQEIVAPGFLRTYRPERVIITNPLYEREIRLEVAGLELDCAFTSI